MTRLHLIRTNLEETYTIGELYVNGTYFCDTLEDKVRDVKVYGQTAIPTGHFFGEITYSNRFGQMMPLIKKVEGFEGIRIHSGNTHEDTHGCILVGRNKVKGKVIESVKTYTALMEILENEFEITIE